MKGGGGGGGVLCNVHAAKTTNFSLIGLLYLANVLLLCISNLGIIALGVHLALPHANT